MKPPSPQPVAFCWKYGIEMGIKDIERKGCRDPEKQVCSTDRRGRAICHHLQYYGKPREGRYIMQETYEMITRVLESNGITLEGKGMALVKQLPNGSTVKLRFPDAAREMETKVL